MIIYKTTNIKNGRFYIGKDKHNNPTYIGSGILLKQAIKKYGKNSFQKEILEHCDTESELNEREMYWISKYRCDECYNIANGGEGGDVFTNKPEHLKDITRAKLSKFMKNKDNNPMYNKKSKDKLLKTMASDEYKFNMKVGLSKYWVNPENTSNHSKRMKEILDSSEMRKKWSECKTGSKNGRWLGNVEVTDCDGITTVYESAVEAHKKLRMAAHTIREHCRNGTTPIRGAYKGYGFKLK
jgi:group I intron endonuclease